MKKVGIKVTPEFRNKLIKWKYDLDCSSLEELLKRMVKIIQFHKLAVEIKEVK